MKIIELKGIDFSNDCHILTIKDYTDFEKIVEEMPVYRGSLISNKKKVKCLICISLLDANIIYIYEEEK